MPRVPWQACTRALAWLGRQGRHSDCVPTCVMDKGCASGLLPATPWWLKGTWDCGGKGRVRACGTRTCAHVC